MSKHNVIDEFGQKVQGLIDQALKTQTDALAQAAEWVADTVQRDGIIYTFGTGHSHMVAEEIVYRAGALAPVDAILEPSMTGTNDVVKSELMERLEGVGKIISEHRRISSKDLLIVISNSGRNAAPIEMAMEAKARGAHTVAITSLGYSKNIGSRHSSGKKLYEVADVVIDNGGPLGDAVVQLPGLKQPIGPTSNIIAMFLLQALMAQAVQNLLDRGVEPPVFWSGNLDGSRERNQAYLDRYWGRIRTW